MNRCTVCGMPDTHPTMKFAHGVCAACINYDRRKYVDWENREKSFKTLTEKKVLIPVSGGKDSHYLVRLACRYDMDALLFHVADYFPKTEAGIHNLQNLQQFFPMYIWKPEANDFRDMVQTDFETSGEPLKTFEKLIYSKPVEYASDHNFYYVL